MKVLWVAGEHPHPARTGLHAYSGGLVGALAEAGADVVALAMAQPGDPVPAAGCWRLSSPQRPHPARSLLSTLPNVTFARATPEAQAALGRALAEGGWDAVVIDHLQSAWALDPLRHRPPGTALVYVAHNHEANTRPAVARAVEGGLVRRAVLRADAWKAAAAERRLVGAADLVTAISEEDESAFHASVPGRRLVLLPPGFSGHRALERRIDDAVPRRVLLLGSLEWHVKQANLLGFLRAADPLLAAAGVEVMVAGPAPAAFVERAERGLRATRFLGRVDDLPSLLATARMGIVSEPAGGGFKLKTLDYAFGRVPMAVLAGSVAGLPLEPGRDLLERPDNRSLARAVIDAIDDLDTLNRLHEHAYRRCQDAFDWPARGRELLAAIAAVAPAGRR